MSKPPTSEPGWLAVLWNFASRVALCSSLLGLFACPSAPSLAAGALTTLLTLPLAMVATLLVAGLARTPLVRLGRRRGLSRWICAAVAAGVVFSLGAYVANVAMVDDPLQAATLIACGVAGVAGLVTMAMSNLALRRSRVGYALDSLPVERVVGPVAFGVGLGLVVLDSSFLSDGYLAFHFALLGLALTCLAACAAIVAQDARVRRVTSLMALGVLGLSALVNGVAPAQVVYVEMASSATLHQRLLLLARRAFDRDGDGFAAAFGGGDCDDGDKKAFPLSKEGRDCLQWRGRTPPPSSWHPPAATEASSSIGPRVVLLVTVDALRCDSGSAFAGLPPLCPRLEQLAREGRQRVPAHTTYPSTAYATLSLNEGTFYPQAGTKRRLLADVMKEHGRTTHAVSTHAKQMPAIVARSFDTVDTTLQSQTSSGSASTSTQVTERVLRWLKNNHARPAFIWAHYYDPHSPYVDPPGSHSALAPATARYAAEVRRTESEVARLIRAAAASEPSLFALVTADHGEEFAEHGSLYHGTTLFEAVVRVPMIAWSAKAEWSPERADLPASTAEVAPFLISVARAESFESRNEAFFWVSSHGKRRIGIYRDPYKLTYDEGLNLSALYNIAEDPAEMHNLVQTQHALRDQLGSRMAAYLEPAVEEPRADVLTE